MSELETKDAVEILLSEKKKAEANLAKAYDSYCIFPNEHDQEDWDNYSALAAALEMAVEALEKQIPKKPVMGYAFPEKLREVINRTNSERAESKTECCPVCGRTLGVSQFVKTQTGLHFGDPHCKRCGQAIDWAEDE